MENERHDDGVTGSVAMRDAAQAPATVPQAEASAAHGVTPMSSDRRPTPPPVQSKGFIALTMPTVGGIVGLALLTVLIMAAGEASLGLFIWGLMFLFFVLPCGLVGALICGMCLAGSRSQHGAGTVALAALGAAVGIPLLWAAISIIFD